MILRLSTVLALALTFPAITAAHAQTAPAAQTSAPAYASDKIIGSFIAVEGAVTVTRDGAEKPEQAAAATPLYRKDKIETGPDSRAVAVLLDESELILGAGAETTIDEYIYNPEAQAGGKARLSFLRGAFQYASGMIGKVNRPDIELTIPYGTIGLRGTRVWGGELDQYGVLVIDGKVSVRTRRGTTLLSAGEGVDLASPNAAPANRSQWESEKVARAVATVTLAQQDEATARITAEKERLRTARGGEPEQPAAAAKTEKEKPAATPASPSTPAPDKDAPPRANALEDAPEPLPFPKE